MTDHIIDPLADEALSDEALDRPGPAYKCCWTPCKTIDDDMVVADFGILPAPSWAAR